MLQKIGAYDAKTKLPEILRRVEAGESFTMTNRGKPVADITPTRAANNLKAQTTIENILSAKKHLISDDELLALKNRGQK
jgi:prevent-host-death family protein